jgi:hypothetical protein
MQEGGPGGMSRDVPGRPRSSVRVRRGGWTPSSTCVMAVQPWCALAPRDARPHKRSTAVIIAVRPRTTATAFVLVAGAAVRPAPPAGAAGLTAPSSPGAGYTLDWENATDRILPTYAPNGWHEQYLPGLRHDNGGEPQARVASAAAGEPVRAGAHSVRFEPDRTDPLVSNGVQAESEASPSESLNAERWYGSSTFLPASYNTDPMPKIIPSFRRAMCTTAGSASITTHHRVHTTRANLDSPYSG